MSNNRNIDIDAEYYAEVFKALGNPHRFHLFLALASCCETGAFCRGDGRACVGDLSGGMDLAPSTVSHHLKELREAGLIHMERKGQSIECWVDPGVVSDLAGVFKGLKKIAGGGSAKKEKKKKR